MKITLDYHPSEKQRLLHETAVRQILFGGAAGGGKSHAMRWDAYGACLANPGLDAYLFRRTRAQLENTHIKRLAGEIPEDLARYHDKKNRLEFVEQGGARSYLNFCYAEAERDVDNYDSVEFHWLGLDEAGHFSEYQLSYLRTRCRLGAFKPQEDIFPRLIMSANPGGISHHWLKSKYMDPAPPMTTFDDMTMVSKATGKAWSTMFIPARMSDNPHLDADYDAAFGDLPEWKQRMLVDGDWDVVAGAFFDCFNRHLNVVPRMKWPDHLTRFMAMDYGFAYPFSIGWYVVMDGETYSPDGLLFPAGSVVRYREWYGCQYTKDGAPTNKGLRMRPAEIAKGILSRENGEEILYRVAPADMWRAETGQSAAEGMARAGVSLVQADRERVNGWQRMYNMIDGMDYELNLRIPLLYVTEDCTQWIRTVPAVTSKEGDPDDVEKQGEDHIADETRYAIMSRPLVREPPKKRPPITKPLTFDELMRQNDAHLTNRRRMRI